MALSRTPFTTTLLLLALLQLTAAAVVDFSLYPSGAQPCLYNAASASKCDSSSVPVFNSCVCTNGGGFIDSAAKCIGANDKTDLNSVYSVMSRNCGDSSTPIAYSLDKYLQVAGAGASSATSQTTKTVQTTITSQGTTKTTDTVLTTATPSAVVSTLTLGGQAPGESASVTVVTLVPVGTSSSSPSTSNGAAASNKGLSTGAIVGIGVGVGVPLVLALLGLIAVLIWRGKRKTTNNNNNNINGAVDPAAPSSTAYPPSSAGFSPRPMSTTTTLDNYNRYSQPGVAGVAAKHDYSPVPQYSSPAPGQYPVLHHGQPVYEAQDTPAPGAGGYPPNAYVPPPQPGHVEMPADDAPPSTRPQELPGNTGYRY